VARLDSEGPHTSAVSPAAFLLVLAAKASIALKLAPASIDSLVKRSAIILWVSPTKNPYRPIVRENIRNSIGRLSSVIDLDPTPNPNPKGTPGEATKYIWEHSIVLLHRTAGNSRGEARMTAADRHIGLHLGASQCVERSPLTNLPPAQVVDSSVYFRLPSTRKHLPARRDPGFLPLVLAHPGVMMYPPTTAEFNCKKIPIMYGSELTFQQVWG
jgi:hypothetical protein